MKFHHAFQDTCFKNIWFFLFLKNNWLVFPTSLIALLCPFKGSIGVHCPFQELSPKDIWYKIFEELYLKHHITNFSTLLTFNNLFKAVMCKSPIECQRASFYGFCFNNLMVMFLLVPFCNQSCDFDGFNLMTI